MATKAEHVTALKAQHSSLTRLVDGVTETLSDSEYEAMIDDWATAGAAGDVRNELKASGGASADYASFRTDPISGHGYKDITEQLDQLWHDIDDGKLDKTGSWYTAIKAVKAKYTKP